MKLATKMTLGGLGLALLIPVIFFTVFYLVRVLEIGIGKGVATW